MEKTSNAHNASFVTIDVIDNAIEAQLISSILTEQEIPHQIISHHDTAYDGLYQLQKGWGEIKGPQRRKTAIQKILDEIRNTDQQPTLE